MKLNLEKIGFYLMLIIVSGSIGYALKPAEQIDHKQSEIDSAQNLCVQGTLQPLVEDLAQL